MTAGFLAVFGVFGLLIVPVAAEVQQYLPWVTVVLGAGLLVAGGWLVAGRSLPALPVPFAGGRVTGGTLSPVGFGVGYALASLSCTLAPFLTVVLFSFRIGSVGVGIAAFASYAAGMGLVVGTAAVAVALASQGLVGRLRAVGRYVPRASGLLLLLAGAYAWPTTGSGSWVIRPRPTPLSWRPRQHGIG